VVSFSDNFVGHYLGFYTKEMFVTTGDVLAPVIMKRAKEIVNGCQRSGEAEG
jgi:hypothetical protein